MISHVRPSFPFQLQQIRSYLTPRTNLILLVALGALSACVYLMQSRRLKKANQELKVLRQELAGKKDIPQKWGNYTENICYSLVGRDFCSFWTLVDAIRDLFQNAMDSMLEQHRLTNPNCKNGCSHWISVEKPPHLWEEKQEWVLPFYVYDGNQRLSSHPCGYLCWRPKQAHQGPTLTIINIEAKLGEGALMVGCTTKKQAGQDAGGYGEGLKAAAAVAGRAGLLFEIFQSKFAISFATTDITSFTCRDPANSDLSFGPLTRDYCRRFNVSIENDVMVHLGGGQNLRFQHLQKGAEQFLSLTHRQIQISSPEPPLNDFKSVVVIPADFKDPVYDYGQNKMVLLPRALLLGKDMARRVYVKGIRHDNEPEGQTNWGIDLAREDVINRDRRFVPPPEYSRAVGKIIVGLIDKSYNVDFQQAILQELESPNPHIADHLKDLAKLATQKTCSVLGDLFRKAHPDVKYLIPGTSKSNKNELTPRWCDISVCRIVHPILYELLSDEVYPSLSAIRKECSRKLKSAPIAKNASEGLRAWIRQNKSFLFLHQNRHLEESHLQLIEVRNTDALDVPQFIVGKGNPLPKLIFSQRAMQLNKPHTQRQFLSVIKNAFKELYGEKEGTESINSNNEPEPEKLELPPLSPASANQGPLNIPPQPVRISFTPSPAKHDDRMPDDGIQYQNKLQQQLTQKIRFNGHVISCTPASGQEWKSLISTNPRFTERAKRAIEICERGIVMLCKGAHPLKFYIAKENPIDGYATSEVIHLNLGRLLDFGTSFPTDDQLKAILLSTLAHEQAHVVNMEDDHGPDHGYRTELNRRVLDFNWSNL